MIWFRGRKNCQRISENRRIKRSRESGFSLTRYLLWCVYSVLRELARCLRVSTTYLLDGEIECFDKDVMQIAIVLQGIESEELRNVALEQLKVLVRVADLRNLRNR